MGSDQNRIENKPVNKRTPLKIVLNELTIFGYILGLLIIGGCLAIAAYMGGSWRLNYLLCLFGGTFGWAVGILLSPRDDGEKSTFSAYGAAILTFSSGVLVAKLDKLENYFVIAKVDGGIALERALLFGTMFIIGALFSFVGRLYLPGKEEDPA